MKSDINGLLVDLDTPDAVEAWNALQQAFLAHSSQTPVHLARVLDLAPDFTLAHAAKGLFYVLLGRSELWPTAQLALDAARGTDPAPDSRDAFYTEALARILTGHFTAAANILETVQTRWPEDGLAMKLGQSIRFMLGDARGMRRLATDLDDRWAAHPFHGYLLGCQAFALEETGDYREAEAKGRAGLELCPDDAWGLHAVAHVHDMQGRAADGVRWLAGKSQHWAHCNNFGFHVWWHLALFHLDRGAFEIALELYDRKVRAEHTDDFRDISNGASLLFRLEAEGVDVGHRWEELGALCSGRVDDGAVVFADLHYQLALIRSGRANEADSIALRLTRDAGIADHDQHEVAAISGATIASGLTAFRGGHYADAVISLESGLHQLPRIGGSHAQRDIFHRITVEAAFRGGKLDIAERLLRERASSRGAEDGYHARRMDAINVRRREVKAAGIAAQ